MRIRYSNSHTIFNIYPGFYDERYTVFSGEKCIIFQKTSNPSQLLAPPPTISVGRVSAHHYFNNQFAVNIASEGTTEVQRKEPIRNIVWEKARKRMPWWPNDVICGPPSTKMNHTQKNRVIRCWMGAQTSLNRVNFKVDLFSMLLVFFIPPKDACEVQLVLYSFLSLFFPFVANVNQS